MIPFRTPRLIVRNWEERDRETFHLINSDDRVMRFFPFRRDRAEADAFMNVLRERIAQDGFGFTAVEIAATGETIGFVGMARTNHVPSLPPDMIEIGWRLAPDHWGKGYASEAARAWTDRAFANLDIDRVISFAVWNNEPSTAVMRRLGMTALPERDFDHAGVPDTHPHLKRHVYYEIRRENWPAS
jgi:RimJ/RimL family protein N-acetyltransferase